MCSKYLIGIDGHRPEYNMPYVDKQVRVSLESFYTVCTVENVVSTDRKINLIGLSFYLLCQAWH